MAIRFRRSIKLVPGLRLNIGTKSASLRIGAKGVGFTTGTAGKRISAGIPGTGLHFSQKVGVSELAAKHKKIYSEKAAPVSFKVTLLFAVGLILLMLLTDPRALQWIGALIRVVSSGI
jgi:hypothetical protein